MKRLKDRHRGNERDRVQKMDGKVLCKQLFIGIEVFLGSQYHLFLKPVLQVMLVKGLLVLCRFCAGK